MALISARPPLKSAVLMRTETWYCRNGCTFNRWLSRGNPSAAYASADIFVMPSESETLGFVVLEVS